MTKSGSVSRGGSKADLEFERIKNELRGLVGTGQDIQNRVLSIETCLGQNQEGGSIAAEVDAIKGSIGENQEGVRAAKEAIDGIRAKVDAIEEQIGQSQAGGSIAAEVDAIKGSIGENQEGVRAAKEAIDGIPTKVDAAIKTALAEMEDPEAAAQKVKTELLEREVKFIRWIVGSVLAAIATMAGVSALLVELLK